MINNSDNSTSINNLPLTNPIVARWKDWHFGKVKQVSDIDIQNFVACEQALRLCIPRSSIQYMFVAKEIGSRTMDIARLPVALGKRNDSILKLSQLYNVAPEIVIIRFREIIKENKKSPRYDEVMRLYVKSKHSNIRGRS